MTDLTDQLDSIQNRLDEAVPTLRNAPMDIGFLLDLARKQQAAIDAVRDIAASIPRSLARENNEPSEADYALLGFSNRITEALEAKP